MTRRQPLADQVVLLYDAAQSVKDGLDYADARAKIVPDVIKLLPDKRDTTAEAERLIDASVRPVRRTRRADLRAQLEYVLDTLFVSHDEGANIDALLDVPYPLGSAKGHDKALKYWAVEDFRDLVSVSWANAADVTAAARELQETVEKVIDAMVAQHADTFGDLDDDGGDDD